jgi:hypothetical protein
VTAKDNRDPMYRFPKFKTRYVKLKYKDVGTELKIVQVTNTTSEQRFVSFTHYTLQRIQFFSSPNLAPLKGNEIENSQEFTHTSKYAVNGLQDMFWMNKPESTKVRRNKFAVFFEKKNGSDQEVVLS